MKAALLTEIGQPFTVQEVPRPTIGPDEVLVETRTCGICRTDLHIQDGLAYVPTLPHIPGHEPAGVIAAVGDNVRSLEVGQRVVPHLFLTCGHCRYCRTGRDAQCAHVAGIIGVTRPGGFAEYFVAPARNLLVIPDNVPFDIAGLTSCAVITAIHAYRRVRLALGDMAMVVGAGGIGLIMIQLLKAAGLGVIAASRSPDSLNLAAESGADLTVRLGTDEAAQSVREFTGGAGVQCAFEMVGLGATMKFAADCAARGGQIVVIGEEAEFPAVDTITIAQRELEIIGSRNGSRQDAVDALAMMSADIVRPKIYRRFPLDEFPEAMQYMRSGQPHGRVVIEMGT
jgi:D-arabinose 1-dehydrogenase-like Zn-dependent alcohol dehydrogenase